MKREKISAVEQCNVRLDWSDLFSFLFDLICSLNHLSLSLSLSLFFCLLALSFLLRLATMEKDLKAKTVRLKSCCGSSRMCFEHL